MKKLIALIKIIWYYRQSEKAINKGFKALKRKDLAEADRLVLISKEYENKADACYWAKNTNKRGDD